MKNKNWPKVSVIISTYNRPKKLNNALRSVYEQTFDDFEVVVVDDCTPDQAAMREVLEKWEAKFEKRGVDLWAYRLEINSGYNCFPYNRGIEKSRGDYIAYLDDDNIWRPDHLQVCVDAIEASMSVDMVYTRMCNIVENEETQKILDEELGGKVGVGDTPGVEWNHHLLAERNYIDTNTMLHSKGAFWHMVRESGYGWDEKLRRFGDWNFVWRWGVFGNNAKLVDKVTVDYYLHKDMLQLSRPPMEVPVCFNYEQYLASRKNKGPSSQSPS